MSASKSGPRVLVVNQHGENRGDEAAMRAMLTGIGTRVPDAQFVVATQFADRDLTIQVDEAVVFLPMFRSMLDVVSISSFALLLAMRIRAKWILTRTAKALIEAYESSDLVISAPGGPYFGDIYARHEIFHWLFVWLAGRFGLEVLLYAPSAGPFHRRFLNRVRRRLFPRFRAPLCVREPVSAEALRSLLGDAVKVEVTADAAFQERVEPHRAETIDGATTEGRLLVAVSAIDFAYPGSDDPQMKRARYDDAIRSVLGHLADQHGAQLLLFPQLYGSVHSDVPYLERLASALDDDVEWEIVDPSADSDGQRALLGGCDLCIASRYHPQVFAVSAGVPGICIYYEHKALGVMQQVGLEQFAFDIRDVDASRLIAGVEDVIARRDEVVATLRRQEPVLRERSAATTSFVTEALRSRGNVIA